MTQSLYDAAQQAFRARGGKMTMGDIADIAGVSRATVYQKLGGKAEILKRLAAEHGQPELAHDIDDRILQGLLDTADRHGFRAATIDDIATAAGVGVATIYRRFGDKEGLIRAFIASRAPVSQMMSLPIGSGSARTQLRVLIQFLFDYMSEHRALVRLVHSGSAEDRSYVQALRDADTSTFARITAFFRAQQTAGTMAKTIPPEDLATNLFGMLYGHTVLADGRKTTEAESICKGIAQMFETQMIGDAT